MAYDKFFPALTTEGWVTDKKTIMEKIFLHYLCSEKSQSSIFKEQVRSLKYTLQQNKDEHYILEAIRSDLNALYGSYFPIVEVLPSTDKTDTKLDIVFNVVCYDENNNKYDLQKVLDYKESSINNFQNLVANIRSI